MNLEKVLSELKFLKGSTQPGFQAPLMSQTMPGTQPPESITANMHINHSMGLTPSATQEPEVYGYVPKKKKKKEEDEEEPHLMRPSDLFKKD